MPTDTTPDFTISRRGYEREEVDRHLATTSSTISLLREQVAALEGRVRSAEKEAEEAREAAVRAAEAAAAARSDDSPGVPNPDAPASERFAALGEETTRILVAAEESAREMRESAERQAAAEVAAAERAARERVDSATEHATTMVAEAEERRSRILSEAEGNRDRIIAETEAERERIETETEAERRRIVAETEAARQRIVSEAEAERQRIVTETEAERQRIVSEAEGRRDAVIGELERRQSAITADIDARVGAAEAELASLRGTRATLLGALRGALTIADEAVTTLEEVPEEALTAPIATSPREVGTARAAATTAAETVDSSDTAATPWWPVGEEDGSSLEAGWALPEDADEGDEASEDAVEDDVVAEDEAVAVAEEEAAEAASADVGGLDELGDLDVLEADDEAEAVAAIALDDESVEGDEDGSADDEAPVRAAERHGAAPSALRSALADATEAADVGALTGDGEESPGLRRERSLASVRPGTLRRLRRGLQDVQNGVLQAVRDRDEDAGPESILPGAEAADTLAELARPYLDAAYRAGVGDAALLAGEEATDDPAADELTVQLASERLGAELLDELSTTLLPSLRAGMEADEADASLSERVGEVFRDLKGPIVETVTDRHLTRAYGRATLDEWQALGVDRVDWVLGEETRCPEGLCRTNASEGWVATGTDFPSGDALPPVHDGCTCAIAPVRED